MKNVKLLLLTSILISHLDVKCEAKKSSGKKGKKGKKVKSAGKKSGKKDAKGKKKKAGRDANNRASITITDSGDSVKISTPVGDSTNRNADIFIPPETRELDIRFSKVMFPAGVEVPEDFLPLTARNFPVEGETAFWLKESYCPSVVTSDDYECDINVTELIEAVGGLPPYPTTDPNGAFWDELNEVLEVRDKRLNGVPPGTVLPLPDTWDKFDTLDKVAEAVHDEFPGIHHITLMEAFLGEGISVDHNVIPRRCYKDFLRGPVMLADLSTWSIGIVGPLNFAAKYIAGLARPEEIAFKIAQGSLTSADGVPSDLENEILSLGLESAEEFTAYEEGSPMHPSWPAMHSAASSASLWLAVVLNLTPHQLCQTKLVDYAVAYARTVAGVHYPMDNIAGLNMGQEIIARKLGDHLATKYGSNKTAVDEKIDAMRFDWREFDPWSCLM